MIEFWERLQRAVRPAKRRITLRPTRALVEFRGVPTQALPAFEEALQTLIAEVPGIEWVHVNPWLERAVFAFEEGAVSDRTLITWVQQAEREVGAARDHARTLTHAREIPDDELLELQRSIELLAEVGGLGLGLGLRLIPFAPTRLGANMVALLSLVQMVPAIRQRVEDSVGIDRTDFVLSLSLAFANALAERPMSSLVEMGNHAASLRELRARRKHWMARVDDICAEPASFDLHSVTTSPRPVPLPKGAVETYVDRATTIAASSASVALLTTWSPRRATAALFAALPIPAQLGRKMFTAELTRALAEHGTLVLAPDALQRLDRVNCLVIESDLVSPARFFVGDITVRGSLTEEDAAHWTNTLFDPDHPLQLQGQEGYRLGPAQQFGSSLEREAADLMAPLMKRGSLALTLTHKGRLAAVVEVRMEQRQGLDDLVTVARKVGLRVVVATDRSAETDIEAADETVPSGEQLPAHIARLQSEGQVVALIAAGNHAALERADCAIALSPPGKPPIWSAHLLCSDVTALSRLVDATRVAKTV